MLGETQQLRQQMGIEATLAEEPPRRALLLPQVGIA